MAEKDRRFVICPGSGFSHGPIGIEITRTGPKRKPTAYCALCSTRVFFGPKLTKDKGLKREQLPNYNAILLEDLEI